MTHTNSGKNEVFNSVGNMDRKNHDGIFHFLTKFQLCHFQIYKTQFPLLLCILTHFPNKYSHFYTSFLKQNNSSALLQRSESVTLQIFLQRK